MKRHFTYPSRDGVTKIHAIEWKPDEEPKAILQICHGMVEYIDRYDEFAEYLCKQGFYVVGNDHLGHGESVRDTESYGFFHETHGNEYVIEDIHELRRLTQRFYPGTPYFMLGHSMGSFLVQQYMTRYGRGLAGVIVMGTGCQPGIVLWGGKIICRLIAAFKGWHYRSAFVDNMAFGGYNKRFEPARTGSDWLTKDERIVDAYLANPWCTFRFTVNAYYHMFRGIQVVTKRKNLKKIPRTLPVIFLSGADDPVGNFGKGVENVYKKYVECGLKDVNCKLYEDDRHELLNETDRDKVYEDVCTWITERI